MNIGIDVDGVLVDLERYQKACGKVYFQDGLHLSVKNPKGYDVCEIYGCSDDERERFWRKYIWRYCLTQPPIKDAPEIIRMLHQQGHHIILITGRAHTTEQGVTGKLFRWMLRHWLKKNNIYYDEMVFCSEDKSAEHKVKACLEKRVDVMVDDKLENLQALAQHIPVICYPAAWNEGETRNQFQCATDWRDVYHKILCMVQKTT